MRRGRFFYENCLLPLVYKDMGQAENDFVAVAVNETPYYEFGKEDASLIERVYTVYVFNRSEHTYCCQLTPSYFLEPAYTELILTDYDVSEEKKEELDEKYCMVSWEDAHYANVYSIERYIKDNPSLVDVYGYAEDIESVLDYYSGNHLFL